jgi:hypothetical protein
VLDLPLGVPNRDVDGVTRVEHLSHGCDVYFVRHMGQ